MSASSDVENEASDHDYEVSSRSSVPPSWPISRSETPPADLGQSGGSLVLPPIGYGGAWADISIPSFNRSVSPDDETQRVSSVAEERQDGQHRGGTNVRDFAPWIWKTFLEPFLPNLTRA